MYRWCDVNPNIFLITMTQPRIDQFYKVTSGSKKPKNVKDSVKESSNVRSLTIGTTKRRRVLGKLKKSKTSEKNDKRNSYKMNEKQKASQDNVSLGGKANCSSEFDSPTKDKENGIIKSSTPKYTSPNKSQQYTPTSDGGRFTPKKSSPIKDALDKSPGRARMARRKLFKDKMEELISVTVNNLNLAKEGAIANNDINLEKVYSSGRFNYIYNPLDTTVSMRYEVNDVIVPTDTYSRHFFQAIINVFSNPINCGYFNEDELDLVFSLITLENSAQALFIRMLKRKHTWHRISNIKYDEISSDLKPIFDDLVSRSIFKSDMEKEDMSTLLNLLQADEIRKLCQESKIKVIGKQRGIQSIMKFCRRSKSLFPGMVSPAAKLRASVKKRLGDCVLLDTRVKEVIDRIITLLIPNRDPTKTLVDIFRMLFQIDIEEIKFPDITISDFPIFVSKEHLLNYIEAKNTLTNMLSAIEEKQWETVRDLGTLAMKRLPLFLKIESESFQDSNLPHYIRHFMPGYMWLKVLYKSIDAFKKSKETMPLAVEFLQKLIDQKCHMKYRKGQWYNELIKIEMHHRKNLEASVSLLSKAVKYKNLTEVDRLDLLDKAERIAKRKSGINKDAKTIVKHMLDNIFSRVQLTSQSSFTIKGTLCANTSQRRSMWLINDGVDEQTYGSVETLALYRYKCEGYIKGIHCEGAFPITLFAMLFWDEIYNMNIPGAWVSLYQDAPLDLYSSEFYENRKEQIDAKLQTIRKLDAEALSKHLQLQFELHSEYESLSQSNIFHDSNTFQEVVFCLGVEGVIGICERLIYNFSLWKAGFPDLIVWNIHKKQYKIVEVKGPGDSLSTKQTLWLDYLKRLGLNTEVCYCESNANPKGRKRKHEETVMIDLD